MYSMRRPWLVRIVVCVLAVIVLAWLNVRVARYLLGFRSFESVKAELSEHLTSVREPLALATFGYDGRARSVPEALVRDLGLLYGPTTELPKDHPDLIPFSDVAKHNPYPPVLWELTENYASGRNWISFLYLGVDDRLHQLTSYSGEADTTPSIFVAKYPASYGGDYYVSYWMLVSRSREDSKKATAPLQVDCIIWDTYAGGSYDAFEEIGLNAALWGFELASIALLVFCRWQRRKIGRSQSSQEWSGHEGHEDHRR
jgi:hypothetical protein